MTEDPVTRPPLVLTWERLTVLPIAIVALRHRRLLAGVPVALAVVAIVLAFFTRGSQASVSFVPRIPPNSGDFGSLAQLLGVGMSIGAAPSGESVDFYVNLVKSHDLLAAAARTEYRAARVVGSSDTLRGDLIKLYKITDDTPQERLNDAIAKLVSTVRVNGDYTTSIITVTVEAPWDGLAEAIARRLLELVNDYNLRLRQTQASAERRFLGMRVDSTRAALRQAEDSMAGFLAANRSFAGSPSLAFQESQLQASVDLRGGVYSTLVGSYENARINEVRNTPVVTVLDVPDGSAIPTIRLSIAAILGFLFGGVVAVGLVLAIESVAAERRKQSSDYDEVVRALRGLLARLTRGRLGAATT